MRGAVRWVAYVALIACAPAPAQIFDATKIGTPADLSTATWRFTTTDDPRNADPAFDDSQWKPLAPLKTFKEQGYTVPSGIWWLRLHARLAPGAKKLAMAITSGSHQVYINGRLVGQQGGFPDRPRLTNGAAQVYSIPAEAASGGSMLIAIRFWSPPDSDSYDGPWGAYAHILLGDETLLRADRAVSFDSDFFKNVAADVAKAIIAFMLGVWALALFRAQPGHREYLWLAVLCLRYPIFLSIMAPIRVGPFPRWEPVVAVAVSDTIYSIAFVLFVCVFLRVPVNSWIRAYCLALLLWTPISEIGGSLDWLSYKFALLSSLVLATPADLFAPLLAVRQYRRGDREAGALLISLLLLAAADYGDYVDQLRWEARRWSPAYVNIMPNLTLGPVTISPVTLSGILFYLSIGGIMLHRSMRIAREQQRTASELEEGRSVQAFLLGRDASAPGFTVESAYLPAQEVGGDFFQTIAGADGSLLAVIGDVAGKGLQAAMRVSMLIGAVRLSPNERPAALLAKLNQVLLQDGSSGLTTCLVARLDADGTVAVANAGHLSPYINGRELAIDGGLPLGVAAGTDYSEQTFPFAASDLMLLMSDGVVEARSASGELFGFERMAQTASAVTAAAPLAEAARAFGQDDDITVLLLRRAIPN